MAALWAAVAAQPALAQPSGHAAAERPVSGSLASAEARRQQLLTAMMADPANLDIAFEYAGLSVEVGDLEGAVSTLERMLIFAPGLPRLQLELGVLYYRLGADEVARTYFEAVLAQSGVPDDVRAKVEMYLAAIGNRGEASGFHGAILVGGRYQTNANSGPSSDIVNLNGVDFVLGAGAMGAPDVNGFVSGSFRYVHDLESQGDRLIATLQTYGALYATQRQLDTGVAEVTFGPDFNLQHIGIDNATLGIYGIGTGVLLGGNPYLVGGGVGANLQAMLGPQLKGGFKLEYRREAFMNSAGRPTASLRSGHRVRGTTGLEYAVNEDVMLFALLTGERRIAEVGYLSLWEIGATAGITLDFDSPVAALSEDWSVTFSAGYAHRRFDAPDPVINASAAEIDHEFQLQGALTVPLGEGWSVHGNAAYRTVISNYDLAEMSNFSVTLGALKEF